MPPRTLNVVAIGVGTERADDTWPLPWPWREAAPVGGVTMPAAAANTSTCARASAAATTAASYANIAGDLATNECRRDTTGVAADDLGCDDLGCDDLRWGVFAAGVSCCRDSPRASGTATGARRTAEASSSDSWPFGVKIGRNDSPLLEAELSSGFSIA